MQNANELVKEVQRQKEILKNAIAIYKNEEAYWKSLRKIARIFLELSGETLITEDMLDKLIIEIDRDENYLNSHKLKQAA